MSEEVRIETRVTDEADVSYAMAEVERDTLGFLDEGLEVTITITAKRPDERG